MPGATYRVLIVDDEPFVRRGIRRSVNWNELGIEMVAEASNGVEALAQFLQDRPDIILLDINMPRMDGLEFANIVKREQPSTRIVIITGYNDFEFARTALRIGVDDYVLKPVTRDNIAGIVREQIAQRGASAPPSDEVCAEVRRARRISDQLNGLLRREPRAEQSAADFCKDYNLMPGAPVRFVCVREYLTRCTNWKDESTQELAQFAILNIAAERLSELSEGFAFATYKNETALVLTGRDARTEPLLDDLRASILDLLEIPVEFGVSERGSLQQLPLLAEHAREALSCCFVLHDTPCIAYEDVVRKKKERAPYPTREEAELLDHMFSEEPETTLGRIDRLFEALSAATIDVRQSRQYLNRFFVTLARTIETVSSWTAVPANADISELSDGDDIRVAEDFETLEEARLWMRDYYLRTYSYVCGVLSRSGRLNLTIRSYIEKNYMNSDLNLKKCSEELYLSASYISSTIRKKSGRSFVDYLNEYRISQAKKLLVLPGARISDVSEKVGFTHPTYFSTVFKKFVGVSPTQYKGRA